MEVRKVGIIAFAFGMLETILSNQRIAQITLQKVRELNASVYTQLDIAYILVPEIVDIQSIRNDEFGPPPTLRIARGAIQWAKRRKITELWIVAAEPHLWRALRDVQQAVREAEEYIEVRICEEIKQYPRGSWFCLNSAQKRTRSWWNWHKRELIFKFMPFFIYKRIAG